MKVTIKEAKERALKAKQYLLSIKSKTKQQKEIIKLIDSFVKCHCSNDAIFKKYAMLKAKMSELQ